MGRTQMIPVNFPGRWGCQRKAGIGRDSREKARSPTFPSVPSFVGNIYTPQWSLISCQLQRAFTLSINITSVDCKTCGFHQDFNSTQTIKEMTVWASNKYELCSCRVWPYRRVRKGRFGPYSAVLPRLKVTCGLQRWLWLQALAALAEAPGFSSQIAIACNFSSRGSNIIWLPPTPASGWWAHIHSDTHTYTLNK